jgi:hypothetical protein
MPAGVRVLMDEIRRELALRADALVIGSDLFFTSLSKQLAHRALRHAVPAIYQFREFAIAGGLLSYGGITHRILQAGVRY